MNIYTEFERAAERYPDKVALEMFRDEGDVRYTYREARTFAERIGRFLDARGIRKGDRVLFWSRLSPNWIVAYLGALRSGIVIVPLDFEYGPAELSSVLDEIDCKIVFSVQEKLPQLTACLRERAHPPAVVLLDADADRDGALGFQTLLANEGAGPLPAPEVGPEDVAMIFFTSGTTGKPKGVVIPHRSPVTTLGGIIQYLRVSSSDKVLGVIPAHHIFASLANVLMPLIQGGAITYPRAINSTELMKTMEKAGITVFPAVPQVFYMLHKRIFDEVNARPATVRMLFRMLLGLSIGTRRLTGLNPGPLLFARIHRIFGGKLRLFVSAASYFDPRIIRDFYGLGFTVQQGYALTETFGGGTFTPIEDNVIGSAGKALPGIELKIVNPDDAGVGEIAISGGSLMQGYLNEPEATAAVLRDGWFYTGDLASMDSAGNVFIRGRRKELIVLSSGKKVYPEEVEQHYLQYPFIKEMCVMGVSDEGDGAHTSDRLHAVIVPDFEYMKKERVVNAKEAIREGIAQYSASLPAYRRILSYEIQTDPLPRTASRKIIRSKVVRQEGGDGAGRGAASASAFQFQEGDDILLATEASRQALAVIRGESRVDLEPHPDMNLELDLGFDSLQRIELLAQIEQTMGLRLGDDVANQAFTVRDLLRTIQRKIEAGETVSGRPAASARVTWREIVANAATDDMAESYILAPTTFSRVLHFLALRLIYLIARIFFRLKVEGLENLPRERPFLICPNHEGYLDGPLVSSVLPYRVIRYMFTLGFTPFFSGGFKDWIARTARIVPVDADTNLGRAMRISAIGLKAKQNLLIFPEGGLSCDGDLQRFKKGVGILASELKVPIVPAAIDGSFEAWSKVGDGVRWFTPVRITFGPPLDLTPSEADAERAARNPDEEYNRIALRIRDAIQLLLAKKNDEDIRVPE